VGDYRGIPLIGMLNFYPANELCVLSTRLIMFTSQNTFNSLIAVAILLTFVCFARANTVFFKIITLVLLTVLLVMILSRYGSDYFGGFLIVAELPIVLISLLFYFHKYSLQVDTLFVLKKVKDFGVGLLTPTMLLVVMLLITYKTNAISDNTAEYYLYTNVGSLTVTSRNDFFIYYNFYYVSGVFYILMLALLLFIVSCLCIFLFFTFKKFGIKKTVSKENVLFVRKQSMLRQAVFFNKLKFFKKQ